MITVYGKTDCIQCESALKLLARKNIPHEYVNLGAPNSQLTFKEHFPHVTKMPYITQDNKVIGGYRELHHGIFALGTIK